MDMMFINYGDEKWKKWLISHNVNMSLNILSFESLPPAIKSALLGSSFIAPINEYFTGASNYIPDSFYFRMRRILDFLGAVYIWVDSAL